jgi:hypothetical protein
MHHRQLHQHILTLCWIGLDTPSKPQSYFQCNQVEFGSSSRLQRDSALNIGEFAPAPPKWDRGRLNRRLQRPLIDIIAKHHYDDLLPFLVPCENDRVRIDWEKLRDDIYTRPNSTDLLKECADFLCKISSVVDLPSGTFDYHHLTPLGIGGSTDDERNYAPLTRLDHIKAHACLAQVLPFIIELQLSLGFMINVNKHAMPSHLKLSGPVSPDR